MFRNILFTIIIIAQFGNAQIGDIYNIVYTLDYKLDKQKEVFLRENFDLVGNKEFSIFESQGKFKRDSLISISGNKVYLDNSKLPKYNQAYSVIKFKDSLLYQEPMPVQNYKYKERLITNWQIITEKRKKVNGYDCMLATTNYGGRIWEAWYTLEIPIQEGPYKFSGLPGLIVELYDQEKHYNFRMHSFKLNSSKNLKFRINQVDAVKTTYKDFLELRISSSESWKGFLNATGVEVTGIDPITIRNSNKLRKKQLNFIELE